MQERKDGRMGGTTDRPATVGGPKKVMGTPEIFPGKQS